MVSIISCIYKLFVLGSQTEILSFFIENNTQNRKLISVPFATRVFTNSLASAAINDLIPVKDPFNANIAKNLSVSLPLLKVTKQNVIQNMKTPLHLLRLVTAHGMCSYFNIKNNLLLYHYQTNTNIHEHKDNYKKITTYVVKNSFYYYY